MAADEHDPVTRVLAAAITIARRAPQRRGSYVSHALIPWPLIEELREALDAGGVEWRPGNG
jgi:hypothetical protein